MTAQDFTGLHLQYKSEQQAGEVPAVIEHDFADGRMVDHYFVTTSGRFWQDEGVKALPGEYGGFLQVSGLTFEVHTYLPSTVKMDEKNMFVGVEGERRVRNVMVAGEPIDPEATYTVASHNYMLMNGGDGNTIFKNNHFTHVDVMLDNQVLLTYVTEALNGVIGEAYANPYGEGRIVAVEAAP